MDIECLIALHLTTGSSCWFWQPVFETASWQVEDCSSARVKIQTVGEIFLRLSCQMLWMFVGVDGSLFLYCGGGTFLLHPCSFDRSACACVLVRVVVKEAGVPEREVVCSCCRCLCGTLWVRVGVCVCFCQSLPVCVRLALSLGGNSRGRSLQGKRLWAFGVQQGLFTTRAPP